MVSIENTAYLGLLLLQMEQPCAGFLVKDVSCGLTHCKYNRDGTCPINAMRKAIKEVVTAREEKHWPEVKQDG